MVQLSVLLSGLTDHYVTQGEEMSSRGVLTCHLIDSTAARETLENFAHYFITLRDRTMDGCTLLMSPPDQTLSKKWTFFRGKLGVS